MSQSKLPGLRASLRNSSAGSSPQPAAATVPGKKVIPKKPQPEKSVTAAPGTPSKTGESTEHLDITIPPASISSAHRDLAQCPCGLSENKSWKMDCSKCHQYWHVECLSLGGLGQARYNKLVDFLCPFCYVAPVATGVISEPGACFVCRNTMSLQQANSQFEMALASEKLKSLEDFCSTVKKIDFDSLTTQLSTVESLDLHLQHFLIEKEAMKEHQEKTEKAGETVLQLSSQMAQLKDQVAELLQRPEPQQPSPSALTDELISDISRKLDQLSSQEPVVLNGLENLKSSVDALEKTAADATLAAASATAAAATPALPDSESSPSTHSDEHFNHNEEPFDSSTEDFVTPELETHLTQFFNERESEFQAEGGRSVLYFGERYKYSG